MAGPEKLSNGDILCEARKHSGVHWREPDPAAYEEGPIDEIQQVVTVRRRRLGCTDHEPHNVSDQLLGPLSTRFK